MSEPDQINSAIKNRTQNITTEIGNDEVGLIVREVSGELKINICLLYTSDAADE